MEMGRAHSVLNAAMSDGVLEHAAAHRLAQDFVHLAGRRADALDAGRRGRRGEELLLRAAGWRLVSVPFYEWDVLSARGAGEGEDDVRRRLREYVEGALRE